MPDCGIKAGGASRSGLREAWAEVELVHLRNAG